MSATSDRGDYTYLDSPSDLLTVLRHRCARCGGTVVSWADEVPCCGGEFDCVDYVTRFACDRCRLITSGW